MWHHITLRGVSLLSVAWRGVMWRYVTRSLFKIDVLFGCISLYNCWANICCLSCYSQSLQYPVCCNRVTRFRLKADTAPYTFYFCGSQQVKVGRVLEVSQVILSLGNHCVVGCWYLVLNQIKRCKNVSKKNSMEYVIWCAVVWKCMVFFHSHSHFWNFANLWKFESSFDIHVSFFFFTVKLYLLWLVISFFSFYIWQKFPTVEDPRCVINHLAWVNLFIIY